MTVESPKECKERLEKEYDITIKDEALTHPNVLVFFKMLEAAILADREVNGPGF